MTCIIGLETPDGVLMGCDSAAVKERDIQVTRLRKVFKRGEFLIGYTTSFRMGQLLQYQLEVEAQPDGQDDLEYLATTFVDAVRDCFKKGGFALKDDDEQELGGEFLVGYRGRLYGIESDFQVGSSAGGYMAVGCGYAYALGSMLTTETISSDGRQRIELALETADHFSNGVCRPFYVLGETERSLENK